LRARDGRRFSCDTSPLGADLLLVRLSGGPDAEPRTRVFSGELSTVERITAVPSVNDTTSEVAGAMLARVVGDAGAETAGLFLVDKTGKNLELTCSVGYSDASADRFRLVALSERLPIVDAVKRTTPVFVGRSEEYTRDYPELAALQPHVVRHAIACVPFVVDGQPIGVVGFGFPLPWSFDEERRALLTAFAAECAAALDRRERGAAEASAGADRATSHLARLQAFSGALARAITPAGVVEVIVDMGMAAASARTGALWLTSDDGKAVCLTRIAGPNGPRPEEHQDVPVERPERLPILDAIRDGTPVWIESRRQFEERYPEAFRAFGHGWEPSIACLPLLAQGRCIGGLTLAFEGLHRFFEDERAFLGELARHAAQAIERARLYAAEKGAKEEVARLLHEARETDRRKDEFLAMLGHELRNPLAPILTALDLMRHRGGDPVARERAIVSRHVRHLVRLVDDLLDVSRVTRGKIHLDKVPCRVSDVFAAALEVASALLDAKHHQLAVSAPEDGPIVMADPMRLSQAIANLLINAAKYTDPGGRISLSAAVEGDEAVVRVQDSGSGIAPEALPRIFDLFMQGGWSIHRAQGGLGIGLTVVKSVVDLHGGSVSAYSEGLRRGSEFVIRLPLAPPSAPPPEPSQHDVGTVGAGTRVLVVDDNQDASYMLGEAFELLECTVRVVHDGASALAAAEEWRPDLVVLDIGLPDVDGYELARRLRRSEATATARIVAVTGYGQGTDRTRSREAGFDEHLVKPVDLDDVQGILARGLR
jgi:signal transduction histidine kinase